MIVLIINYNRLTLPRKLADWCAEYGLTPIFIDNHSTYEPLLQYYNETPYDVMRLQYNYGHKVITRANIVEKLGIKGRYIVTDPDLDLSGVPADFLDVLNAGLDRYTTFHKCGLSLEINDLPDTAEGRFVRNVEYRYWVNPLDVEYFNAAIDTTFALWDETIVKHTYQAIRTNRPYTAKHLSWYYNDFESLPEDEQNYFRTANESASGKKRMKI